MKRGGAGMLRHDMIGDDEDLAREILVMGRSIAPCIDSFQYDSDEQRDAISILKRVYKTAKARGSTMVTAQRIGSASVNYSSVSSAFEGQPTRALRALCGSTDVGGLSKGSFPKDRPIAKLWPEA